MIRRLIYLVIILGVSAAFGCGGRESALDKASGSKPTDLGVPGDWPMGAKMYGTRTWIVKDDSSGETRMWALEAGVPGSVSTEITKYDSNQHIFYEKGRIRRYNLDGTAIHTILMGPKKGETAPSLRRKRIMLDKETGHVQVILYGGVEPQDWDNEKKGGQIVVP